jgi:hypothetical protein
MIAGRFGLIAGAVSAVAILLYIRGTLRGDQPQRVTWVIFTADAAVLLVAQWRHGARSSLWILLPQVAGTLVVMVLSWKRGKGDVTRLDVVLLCAAADALALTWLARLAQAIVLATGAEMIGVFLSARDVRRQPGTEPTEAWLAFAIAGALDIPAVHGAPVLYVVPAAWIAGGLCVPLASLAGARPAALPRLREAGRMAGGLVALGCVIVLPLAFTAMLGTGVPAAQQAFSSPSGDPADHARPATAPGRPGVPHHRRKRPRVAVSALLPGPGSPAPLTTRPSPSRPSPLRSPAPAPRPSPPAPRPSPPAPRPSPSEPKPGTTTATPSPSRTVTPSPSPSVSPYPSPSPTPDPSATVTPTYGG